MSLSPVARLGRQHVQLDRSSSAILTFLIPSWLPPQAIQRTLVSRFSTTPHQCYPRRDNNKNRGVSAIRRTGLRPRQTISVSKEDLPKPVLDRKKRTPVEVDKDHGLWQFFNKERRAIATPEEDNSHGRAWSVEELRNKNWPDLHALWWVCVKERNRLATEGYERNRLKAGYGDYEADERDKAVKLTMRAIKHTLTERWYNWEDARGLAVEDPEVDMSGEGPAYNPRAFEDVPDEVLVEEEAQDAAEAQGAAEAQDAQSVREDANPNPETQHEQQQQQQQADSIPPSQSSPEQPRATSAP